MASFNIKAEGSRYIIEKSVLKCLLISQDVHFYFVQTLITPSQTLS